MQRPSDQAMLYIHYILASDLLVNTNRMQTKHECLFKRRIVSAHHNTSHVSH